MVRDHGNPRIAVVLFQDGYRFIYCMLCQDGDCDVTVRTLYGGGGGGGGGGGCPPARIVEAFDALIIFMHEKLLRFKKTSSMNITS